MDDIMVAVLKGGEVVVDFAGEIYRGLRGGDDKDEDGETEDTTQTTSQ